MNENEIESYGLKIGKRTFISTAAMLLCVMVFAFILTRTVPMGVYQRTIADGREVVVAGSYAQTDGARLPVWRLFTSPLEVFISPDALTAIMIILSIMLIGGVFLILDKCGLLSYAMQLVIKRFEKRKYVLLAIVALFGMLLGGCMGLFEETVILAPIAVALALSLGWDALVGIGMSLMAVGFGFAAGTFNPFTTGVAQRLAGLPLFSGLWLRAIIFVVVYAMLAFFLILYAKRIERNPEKSLLHGMDISGARNQESAAAGAAVSAADTQKDSGMNRDTGATDVENSKFKNALAFFGFSLLFIAVYVTAGVFIPALSDYSMPVIAIVITIGGIVAGKMTGHSRVFRDFGKGIVTFLPSVVLLMLAMSVKQIFVSGGIMDTLLDYAYNVVVNSNPLSSLLIVFVFVLCLEFFIGGAASKAFLIIPLLAPLAELIGLTRQSIVLAFCFGDGFANVIYPTNAVLLIVLGIIGVPYMKWLKWTWKIQLALAAVCVGFLALAYAVGFGPF